LEWNAAYEIGHPELDAEHRSLFGVLAALSGTYCDPDLIDTQVKILEHYAVVHFEREERLMAETGYPFLAEHRKMHDGFRRTVAGLRSRRATEDPAAIRDEMIRVLSDWLSRHIIDVDHGYKDWVVPGNGEGPPSRG
jgi:hemerythrin